MESNYFPKQTRFSDDGGSNTIEFTLPSGKVVKMDIETCIRRVDHMVGKLYGLAYLCNFDSISHAQIDSFTCYWKALLDWQLHYKSKEAHLNLLPAN